MNDDYWNEEKGYKGKFYDYFKPEDFIPVIGMTIRSERIRKKFEKYYISGHHISKHEFRKDIISFKRTLTEFSTMIGYNAVIFSPLLYFYFVR